MRDRLYIPVGAELRQALLDLRESLLDVLPLDERPTSPHAARCPPVRKVVLVGERDRLAGQTLGPSHIPAIEVESCGEAQSLCQSVAVGGLLGQAERLVA